MTAQPPTTPSPAAVAPRAGLALALLLSINLFNYIDRYVLASVLPKLELDAELFRPDDPWLKFKLGWLTTAFLVSYMLLSPVFGRLADTRSRWLLVGIGVILWSLASGGSGLAVGFVALLLTRCLVGVGEAAYGPVAPAMLSDLFPERTRGRVMAWFYMAIPVGSALGFVLGGTVASTALGWRGAFQLVVLPGLILGLLCFLMKDNPKTVSNEVKKSLPWKQVLRELRGIRSFVLCSAGMTCSTFILGGVGAWAPYYIFEREARFQITPQSIDKLAERKASDGTPTIPPNVIDALRLLEDPNELRSNDLKEKLRASNLTMEEEKQYRSQIFEAVTSESSISLRKVNAIFGPILLFGGLVATLFGGWLGDWLRERVRGAYFKVCGYGAFIAFPAYVGMIFVPFPWAWGLLFFAVFFLFINTGPANTILANVTSHRIRATAFAINILIIHALGDAISPPLIGLVADVSSLGTALLTVSAFILGAGLLWTMGAKHVDEETRRVTLADAAFLNPTPE